MLLITLARRVILDFSSCCSFELRARVITFHVCSGACFFMRNEAAQRSMRKSFGHVWWRYSLVQVEIEISAGRR